AGAAAVDEFHVHAVRVLLDGGKRRTQPHRHPRVECGLRQNPCQDGTHDAAAAGHIRPGDAWRGNFADDLTIGQGEGAAIGAVSLLHDALDDADLLERAQGRPAKRNARAIDLPVLVLLDQIYLNTLLAQLDRSTHAADAAAQIGR